MAHRIAYELTHGTIPDGLCVLHSCDTPPCCNPAHLFLGTNADNVADRDRKGRQAKADRAGPRLYPERRPRGERVVTAKLTAEKVRDIRALRAQGLRSMDIAASFGVSIHTVKSVICRRLWSHIA